MSIIIFSGIVAALPGQMTATYRLFRVDQISLAAVILFAAFTLLTIGFIVILQQGARKIPVQYATRVVGRQVFKGQSTQLPLKVDYSGVIAVIFASFLLVFPAQIARYVQGVLSERGLDQSWAFGVMDFITRNFAPGALIYYGLYSLL